MQAIAPDERSGSRRRCRGRAGIRGGTLATVLMAVGIALGAAPAGSVALSFVRTDYKLPSLKATATETARSAEIGPSSGYSGSSVALVDLNKDGRLDLAVADYGTGRVDVLLNKGAGKFAPAPGSPFAACSFDMEASNIVAGQLNPQTDHNPDVAVICDTDGAIIRLLGNGQGGLGAPQTFFSGAGSGGVGAPLKLGHLSGSPGGDYLYGNGQAYACFLPVESTPGGTSTTCDYPTQTTGPGAFGAGITPVHWYDGPCFKGDQVLSFSGLATNSSPATFVGWDLDPRTGAPQGSGLNPCGAPFQASNDRSTGIVSPNAFMAITAADLNGVGPDLDGDNHEPDVVLGDSGGFFHVVAWQGAAGTFGGGIPPTEHPSNFTSVAGPILALRIADLNGDGCPDVAAIETTSTLVGNNYVQHNFVAIHSGHCNTTQFSAAHAFNVAAGPDGYSQYPQMAVGDVNGDGRPDVVTAAGNASSAAASVLINTSSAPDGSGTLTTPTKTVSASAAHRTIAFTYHAAPWGMSHGAVSMIVPSGWSAPSTSHTAPGYTTASTGTVSLSGRTISVSGLTRAAGQTVTITYGSKAAGGHGATAPSATGTQTWATREKSTSGGTLTALASPPHIKIT